YSFGRNSATVVCRLITSQDRGAPGEIAPFRGCVQCKSAQAIRRGHPPDCVESRPWSQETWIPPKTAPELLGRPGVEFLREWEVVGRPFTTAGGENGSVRVSNRTFARPVPSGQLPVPLSIRNTHARHRLSSSE